MVWVKLATGFFSHPKARAVGKDGRELFLASCCWTADSETDGLILTRDLPVLAALAEVKPSVALRLVEVDLWEVHPDGWLVHDYLHYNPSAAADKEMRRKRAEAGRRGGQNSKPPGSKLEALASASGEASPEAQPKQTPKPYSSSPGSIPQTTSSGSRNGQWSDERNRNSTAGHKPSSAEPTAGSQIRAAERLRQQRLVDQPDELDPDAGRAGIAAARAVLVTSEDAE